MINYKKKNDSFMEGDILPADYRSNDLYLVEFPKSGITWLSFILANMLCCINHRELDVTYFNIQQIIPDLHMGKNVGNSLFEHPGYRLLKSHSVFNKRYLHSIYLLRNPFNVMISYYNFCCDLGQFDGSFESFLEDDRLGVRAYNRHATSWLFERKGANRVHLLKYEDLVTTPEKTIGTLMKNLGWCVDIKTISSAIEKSAIENMKEAETTYRQCDPCYGQVFVGRSKSEQVQELSERCREIIYSNTKSICDRFYPEAAVATQSVS